ncbi:hypothetical protein [Stenotrophomonas sp. SPM]|uniref:hypothetical protein n=1 Tax=Stenotrophomonas sp. SPM TaxID=2170735 RepID=UPI0010577282|nr:hypothetical protein [Stenotrophomonas sp. SPM]
MQEEGFNVHLDLVRDWSSDLKDMIRALGVDPLESADLTSLAVQYRMLVQRIVQPGRREVKYATQFECPKDKEAALADFVVASNEGSSLRKYQSRLTRDGTYKDAMLISWGIQHFHLHQVVESDGFVERTDPLLFAIVNSDAVYCIGFWGHGDWSEQEIIGIVHDNWPELIAAHRIQGMTLAGDVPTNEHLRLMRKNRVNAAFSPRPGVLYFPPGGGQTADGGSFTALREAMALQRYARGFEPFAIDAYKKANSPLTKDVSLRGRLAGDRAWVEDESGRVVATVGS